MANTDVITLQGLGVFKEELDTKFSEKMDASLKGAANGVAALDNGGKVPASQLPAYVDDVLEGYKDADPLVELFDEERAYMVGEIVSYNGNIYRFIYDHVAGPFDQHEVQMINRFPQEGESGKIYSDIITDKTYRWSGSAYTQIKGDLVIGTTSGTAFDGAAGATMQQKVNGIAAGAQVNTIETIKVNGSPVTPDTNKAVDISIPVTTYASEADIRALFS
jgi:hypothetical protein